MATEQQTVLVTGGAGFIGSFLCEALLKAGSRVICIDNFSTGHARNIESLLRNPDFQFLRLDINEPFNLETFPELDHFKVKFLGVQEIYHLAMPTVSKGFEQFRMQTLFANSVGTKHVMDIAAKYGAKTVFASSAVVYGNRSEAKKFFTEDDMGVVNHLSPRSAYNEGKRFAETMVTTYGAVKNLEVKIARLFRTYGPRMPLFHGHQIPDFILNALDNAPLTISGTEASTTSLLYVSDAVSGLLRLMQSPRDTGIVNIGSDVEMTMSDIAKRIVALAESSSQITFEAQPEHMTSLGLPELSKAREALSWVPLVRLEDGLQKTIDYIRANKLLLTNGGT